MAEVLRSEPKGRNLEFQLSASGKVGSDVGQGFAALKPSWVFRLRRPHPESPKGGERVLEFRDTEQPGSPGAEG